MPPHFLRMAALQLGLVAGGFTCSLYKPACSGSNLTTPRYSHCLNLQWHLHRDTAKPYHNLRLHRQAQ